MKKMDFTIDNRYTAPTPVETVEIGGKTLLMNVKKELASLLNVKTDEIYLVGNIKPWYFLLHLLSNEPIRNINIILDSENIDLIMMSRLIRMSGMSTTYLQIPQQISENIFREQNINMVYTLMTSLIQPKTGIRVKIQNISRYLQSNGVRILVDGSYATGAINIDVKKLGIDIYLSECKYWLEAPKDTGFLYIKKNSIDIPSVNMGGENKNIIELISLQEPTNKYNILLDRLDNINKLGIKWIENHILSLGGWLIDELNRMGYNVVTPIDRGERGGIISLKMGRYTDKIHKMIREKHGIYTDKIGDHIRICIKKRHDESHIERLIEAYKDAKSKII